MKEKKTALELEAMILQEVRKHQDWSRVEGIVITPIVRTSPDHPNWSAAFVMDGPATAPGAAFQFARELSNRFDLA
jgi:hypothetical protein